MTADKVIDELIRLNDHHNLLIIGNGFDLHLNLKSTFSNFFEARYLDSNKKFKTNCLNVFAYLVYVRFYAPDIGRSFLRRIYATNPNWMDIESFVQKIATDHELFVKIYDALRFKDSNGFPGSFDKHLIQLSLIFRDKVPAKEYDYSTLDTILSDDLTEFENDFASYMKEVLKQRPNYESDALDLVEKILKAIPNLDDSLDTQIINFNYTKIHAKGISEANIHGTLYNKIVIGYDSTTAPIKDTDIFQLSKDWKKLDISFEYSYPFEDINSIIVYGHSLGEQDYPYFFELLDRCHFLEKSDIKMYLCYSLHGKNDYEKKKNFDNYKINASKMLNAYERYRDPSKMRNSIVSSLKLNKRIEFILVE